MSRLLFDLRLGLTGAWFFLGTLIALCILPFRWKDPTLGAILGRLVSWGGTRTMGWRVLVENRSWLYTSQPCIYVANHQSNTDIITMGCMFPTKTVAIGKIELKKIPLFGRFFVGAGMIMIDRSNRTESVAGLNQAKDALLRDGHSIWIFPEGTRNRGRGLTPFKKGAFHIAISTQVPLVPIVQQHLPSYFDFKGRRVTPGTVLIRVLEPIPTKGLTIDELPQLMERVRALMAAELAKPEMKHEPGVPVLASARPAKPA